ncbi:ABC transporter permease [Ferroacidibacillus organovorans]|uniref:Peptide ABC transporter permease n=1 Tax=Ferroacidibacillus organovorans TaxID=1765683 RepID=A0A162UPA7_9BACL|nr:ABC transporter permease [Ferroacidibacillus organovorans]KYP81925.1 peptide ABC transporter permease [Ferroacidibacillus organovorans]OAG94900.1 peptide ABC transporter permease [Ferroacidibacillus organovorans]OPG15021.1 peptide ABC transporter permease [Ferroacidibacillus organovorans]
MRYFFNRLGFLLISLWAAVTLNFVLPRLMPGNPAEIMFAKFQGRMLPQELHALELQFGFSNQPWPIQYFQYLGNMITGHFGLSFTYYPVPVATVIATSLPWTIGAVGFATLLSVIVGSFGGILIAWRRGGMLDRTLPIATMFFQAIPYNWSAFMLLFVFGFTLNWFPMYHSYGTNQTPGFNWPFLSSVLRHGVLPVATIFISGVSGWIIGMRNNMINTLGEDYVVFAEAKGVSARRLMFSYAARNALLPQVTGLAIALSSIVGGSILMEQVFSYPGIGFQLNTAVSNEDYPLIQGMFLIIALCVLIANFIVDMVYARLDPRVRTGGASS